MPPKNKENVMHKVLERFKSHEKKSTPKILLKESPLSFSQIENALI